MFRVFWVLPVMLLLSAFYFSNTPVNKELTLYSGRSKALVEPIIQKFEQDTGIRVQVKYGGTTQLAVALMEEGARTPADVFWAQDAGGLGALSERDLLAVLPASVTGLVPDRFTNDKNTWVATSGRARVLVFSTRRVDVGALPASVFELTDTAWRNRVAWAPANGSFQAFVSAMIHTHGETTTREWLSALKNNGAKSYANNNAILQAIAAGEADLGITNHYYLYRNLANDPAFPVDQQFFSKGDIGNMLNVAGAAMLKPAKNKDAALQFIQYLLSDASQHWFSNDVFEYPVTDAAESLLRSDSLLSFIPSVDLEAISNLEETLKMLRETGLL